RVAGLYRVGEGVGAGVAHPLGAQVRRRYPGEGEVDGIEPDPFVPMLVDDLRVVRAIEPHAGCPAWRSLMTAGVCSWRSAKARRTSGSKPSCSRLPRTAL